MKRRSIIALCGFIGSDKTNLIRRLGLDEVIRDEVLIINDFSNFGVDAELLSEDDKSLEMGSLGGRDAALHLFQIENGGQGGIRTHGTISRTHAFQACSLNHSDTCPKLILIT